MEESLGAAAAKRKCSLCRRCNVAFVCLSELVTNDIDNRHTQHANHASYVRTCSKISSSATAGAGRNVTSIIRRARQLSIPPPTPTQSLFSTTLYIFK